MYSPETSASISSKGKDSASYIKARLNHMETTNIQSFSNFSKRHNAAMLKSKYHDTYSFASFYEDPHYNYLDILKPNDTFEVVLENSPVCQSILISFDLWTQF
jgi:hypothetical protein